MKLLFLCTHNACRSILSEVITRDMASGRLETASAGTRPGDQVHPLTLRYLAEQGYSTDGLHSKSIEAVRAFAPDVVITVCDSAAGESCPLWLGDAVKVHWGLPDPSQDSGGADKAAAFTDVMVTIKLRTQRLLDHAFENMNAQQLTTLLNDIARQA